MTVAGGGDNRTHKHQFEERLFYQLELPLQTELLIIGAFVFHASYS